MKHNCKIHEFSMQIIRGTHAPFTKTYLVRLDFSQRWQVWSLSFLCFLSLFLPALVKIYLYQLISKAIFKLERLFPLVSLATGDCLAIHPLWFRGKKPNRRGFGPDELCSDCFDGLLLSKVVSPHLWNTPLNLYQQVVKGILS